MANAWHELVVEEIIEPELRILDAHHHLWPQPVGVFGQYDLSALRRDTGSGHNIVGTVFLDCGAAYDRDAPEHLRAVGEARYVAGAATESSDGNGAEILAIVPGCDLRWAELDETLDAYETACEGRFRGVRHRLASDPDSAFHSHGRPADPTTMRDPQFRAGLRRLGERGLTFDAWFFSTQLSDVIDVVRATPGTTIVVNHLGGPVGIGPYSRANEIPRWRALMTELAGCENTVLKIGGIGMHFFGAGFDERPTPPRSDEFAAFWRDDVCFAIDAFGPARCLMESNFPVDQASISYPVLWNAMKKMTTGYSVGERADLFEGTARRVYRLPA